MASYRFSAVVISRSSGRSSVAASAYRAADELEDDRTGRVHDYTRKQGVEHAEIIAPENAPDWMRNRAQLWNAVEAAERRKDAQLAREIQLSLPHELTPDERRELVQAFTREHFTSAGMIADVAIHAPNRKGDERNTHAHIMLTMRELTGDGFGKKDRSWNDKAQIEHWREAWADHQNRALEAAGHAARVDHRSFEDRGIDKEPEQHEGVAATAMKRKGEQTRIGEENDQRRQRNTARAREHLKALHEIVRIEEERASFEDWQSRQEAVFDSEASYTVIDFERDQLTDAIAHEERLQAFYAPALATVEAERDRMASIVQGQGFTLSIRRLWRGQKDRDELANLRATIEDTKSRIKEARDRIAATHAEQSRKFAALQERRRQEHRERLEQAEARKAKALSDRLELAALKAQETKAEAAKVKQDNAPPPREEQAVIAPDNWLSKMMDGLNIPAQDKAEIVQEVAEVRDAKAQWRDERKARLLDAAKEDSSPKKEKGQDRGFEP